MGIRRLISRGIEIWRNQGFRSFISSTVRFVRLETDKLRYNLRRRLWQLRYGGAAPSPTELISVDPTEIARMATGHRPFTSKRTTVVGGDWDRRQIDIEFRSERQVRELVDRSGVARLEQYAFFESTRKHFDEGIPWKETAFYRYKLESNEGGHYEDEKKIQSRLAELDNLYESIRTEGYKTQRELREENAETVPLGKEVTSPPERGEVVVAIGRDGAILHVDGRHRLAVARSLGIDEIPVRVAARHTEWQNLRKRVASADEPVAVLNQAEVAVNHPDLRRLAQ